MVFKFGKNKCAVSAVVGVVLMVAITVTIAATTYVYVCAVEEPTTGKYLKLQISPEGYPSLYDKWSIRVWKTVDGKNYIGNNVTITVEVIDEKSSNISIYKLVSDSKGYCEFDYINPAKHKFVATAEGFQSDYFTPGISYVQPEKINHYTSTFNITFLFVIIPFLIVLIGEKKKSPSKKTSKTKAENILLNISIITSILLVVVSSIGLYFISEVNYTLTSFGYPESQTLTYLNGAYWFSILITIIFATTLLSWAYFRYFRK